MRVNASAVLCLSLWLVLVGGARAGRGAAPCRRQSTGPPRRRPIVPPPQYAPPPAPSLVRQNSVGPRLIIAPGVFIPSSGSTGFTLGVVGGYGIDPAPSS